MYISDAEWMAFEVAALMSRPSRGRSWLRDLVAWLFA